METRTHEKPTAILPEGMAVFCWLPMPGEDADSIEVVVDFDELRAILSIADGYANLTVGERDALDNDIWGRHGRLVNGVKLARLFKVLYRLAPTLGVARLTYTPATYDLLRGWLRIAWRFVKRYNLPGFFIFDTDENPFFLIIFSGDTHVADCMVRIDEKIIEKFC